MGRPRKFDTRAVLAAARSEFQAKGYAATSCDDLTSATGLGKGSMYGAFGDKRRLFLSVLADYSAERLEQVRRALRTGGPAIGALRAMLRGEPFGGGPCGRGCLLVNSTCELAPDDEAVLTQARDTFGAFENALAETVERARDEGDLAADVDARGLARLLLAVLQGQEFLAKTGLAASALRQIGETAAASLLGGAAEGAKPCGGGAGVSKT